MVLRGVVWVGCTPCLTRCLFRVSCDDRDPSVVAALVCPPHPHPPDPSRRGKLVIVNLQRTALHTSAALVIHAKCDDVMAKVMAALELEVGTGCPSQWAQLTHALHLFAARV